VAVLNTGSAALQASEQVQQPFLALMLVCSTQQHEAMWEQVHARSLNYHACFSCML
jgi:hypothetical protein